jgi:hypothetical protein
MRIAAWNMKRSDQTVNAAARACSMRVRARRIRT